MIQRFPKRGRRWYQAAPLYVGLAIGAVIGAAAGNEYAVRDFQFALIAAQGKADVHALGAYAMGAHLQACQIANTPKEWPR